jgi:hypothetical protein
MVFMDNLSFWQLESLAVCKCDVVTAGRHLTLLQPPGTGKHFQGVVGQTEPVFTSHRMKCFVFP